MPLEQIINILTIKNYPKLTRIIYHEVTSNLTDFNEEIICNYIKQYADKFNDQQLLYLIWEIRKNGLLVEHNLYTD